MKPRVLSGMRPTGRLHLGNYFGAAKGMLSLQDKQEYQTLYMIADLHAITTPYDPVSLPSQRREVLIDYLSIGLDPQKSVIFYQSDSLHQELFFYFTSVVSIARMQHLPTFKDKVKQHPKHTTMALLNYPILMAADILIYQASLVPVGIDQEPHIEIAREIARKMNDSYHTSFPEPVRFATPTASLPSLLGEGKMSKSVEGSYINLTDDLDTITSKLSKVPTDSGQGEAVPTSGGVASLLTFVELFQGTTARQTYEEAYQSPGIRYKELKQDLAQAIYQELQPIQAKRAELEQDPDYVDQVIQDGATQARAIASDTLQEVRQVMGFNAKALS